MKNTSLIGQAVSLTGGCDADPAEASSEGAALLRTDTKGSSKFYGKNKLWGLFEHCWFFGKKEKKAKINVKRENKYGNSRKD